MCEKDMIKRSIILTSVIIALTCLDIAFSKSQNPQISWQLVAKSHTILSGTLKVPIQDIKSALSSGSHKYIVVEIAPKQLIKGKLGEEIPSVRYYTQPRDYAPRPESVIALDGREAIIFLVYSDDPYAKGFYFSGSTPKVLQPFDSKTFNEIKKEVDNQYEVLRNFEKRFSPEKDKLFPKVKRLVESTLDPEKEHVSFKELERLAMKGVPSIIILLDDRRPLPNKYISLKNALDQWESVRHYSPELVVDALAAILNQITGESFGFIYNGGSERERRETVNGWRIYLYYMKTNT
jgi:hypothetical protein